MPIRRARCGSCQAKSADNTGCCKGERRQWRKQRTEAGAAVAECEGLLPPKHNAGTATRHYRAFWQRRCRAAAAGAVLKPSGGNCAVLPKVLSYHYIVVYPSCASSHESAWGVSEKSKLSSISTNTAGFCVKKPWNPQRIPAALCLTSCLCLRNIRHFLCFQIHFNQTSIFTLYIPTAKDVV